MVQTNIQLAYTEWNRHRLGEGPTLIFAHATGFHGRIWDEIIGHLGERHIISIDQRGHGNSSNLPVTDWREFAEDLIALITELGLKDLVGIGHSMGGHAMLDAAGLRQDLFSKVIAIDPTIAAPSSYKNLPQSSEISQGHPASRRKDSFSSVREMVDRFKDRSPYSLFTQKTLENYCAYGLVETDDGFYQLACPPILEANVYMTSRTNRAVYDSLKVLELPTLLIRACRNEEAAMWDFTNSPTWPGLITALTNGTEIYLKNHTHFVPMEIPEKIADMILEFL